MTGHLPLVALDSCVFVEAAKVPRGLCNVILGLAARRLFRVLLVPRVNFEVRRELEPLGLIPVYEEWLRKADVHFCQRPTCAEVKASIPYLWPRITHCPDYRVAVSVRQYTPRYFITSNMKDRKDWDRSPELRAALGGVAVVLPARYLKDLGVSKPPKWGSA